MQVTFKKKDRILIVAPHPDDETIGCGGLLSMYGKQCDILMLTDGRHCYDDRVIDENTVIKTRQSETKAAMKLVGVKNIYFLNIEDSKLSSNIFKVMKFDISKYSYIFVPNRNEAQSDHKIVLGIFRMMKLLQRSKAQIYEYEVWTALRNPTWILDISKVIDTKKKMIKKYKSQLEIKNYYDSTIGLNSYRGLAYNYKFGEAYTHYLYSDFKGKVYQLIPDSLKTQIQKIVSK